jgi:proline iminopeptidase
VNASRLYIRDIGRGPAVIVLHGGPDFDHTYLLPELNRLSDSFHLIYYDQRGRGRSAQGVQPEDVTLESEIADLDAVRQHFGLDSAVLLGHSWGTVLALEYANRHPDRVSALILMNPAPASRDDFLLFAKQAREQSAADLAQMKAIAATPAYEAGDPDMVAAYYRIHFKPAVQRAEHLDQMIAKLRASFTADGILKARAIEDRLMDETWSASAHDLLPKLTGLRVPTVVIWGDHEFVPEPCAAHIASAIPDARLVTLKGCGHFAYLECPGAVRNAIDDFLRARPTPAAR